QAHWVKPVLVAEVSFSHWTQAGRIRHAVFRGLRNDKPPTAIMRESAMPIATRTQRLPKSTAARVPASARNILGNQQVTHSDRIIDPSTEIRKIDLVRYYALVGGKMLPHLKHRPVSLVRAPE